MELSKKEKNELIDNNIRQLCIVQEDLAIKKRVIEKFNFESDRQQLENINKALTELEGKIVYLESLKESA